MCGVFIDREKLSSRYVPPQLPHRDAQLRTLEELLHDVVRGEAEMPRVIQLVGPTGTGKTSSVYLLHRRLSARGGEHLFIYLNLRIEGSTPFLLFSTLYERLTGHPASRSLSAQEVLRKFLRKLREGGKPALIVLDEVEYHAKGSLSSVIYTLTRLQEMGVDALQVATLFVARSLSWLKLLDPAERSSLGNIVISYPPYTREQLFDILLYRASEAFKEDAAGEDLIQWLADYTYTYMASDVRRALDTLFYAGILAEQDGSSRVTLDHVLKALRNLDAFIAPADVQRLSPYEQVVLYSALKLMEISSKPYVRLSELWEKFLVVSEQVGLDTLSLGEFEDIVQRLVDMGALLTEGPARIAPAPSINLEVVEASLKSLRYSYPWELAGEADASSRL
ncbi:MAG: hypothetical protein DRK00_03150 [Thermoprotei archaeon]|nr:MAG: hypothetical protein DRK00_03150 [Thermoprotei archaeon]